MSFAEWRASKISTNKECLICKSCLCFVDLDERLKLSCSLQNSAPPQTRTDFKYDTKNAPSKVWASPTYLPPSTLPTVEDYYYYWGSYQRSTKECFKLPRPGWWDLGPPRMVDILTSAEEDSSYNWCYSCIIYYGRLLILCYTVKLLYYVY